ncbi:MAG: nitroreductase family protein [Spirochaetales bacterium]|nr:nitroreductase family protein [Spirochaetales bacterium]
MSKIIKEIVNRRARRALSRESVPADVLRRILDAATNAPSCANKQPWKFLICNEAESLAKLRNMLTEGNYWAKKAPVLIAIFAEISADCMYDEGRNYALFDCGLAAENLMLQATHENMIAHPMAGFNASGLKKEFNLPQEAIPIVMIALGYPGDDTDLSKNHKKQETAAQVRKQIAEVCFYNTLDAETPPAEIV